jgi:hypothetical protein
VRTGPKVALAGAAAALVAAWPVAHALEGDGTTAPLRFRDLSPQLGPLEFPRPTARVYLTREKLQKYLDDVMPGGAPALPPIDFGREKALLVAVGPRSSTGYELSVVSVVIRGGHPRVTLRERAPGTATPVVSRVTYPYRLITIPRTTQSTQIELQGRP